MKEILKQKYGLDAQEVIPLSRKDSGNDNELFRVIDSSNDYFLKEIPGHSKRDDLELIYSELTKCNLSKSKMVLPIKSLEGKYLVRINDKDMMMYNYLEHHVFNEADIAVDKILEVLTELFIGLEKIEIPKHPFKNYNNWFERGVSQLKQKVENHAFLDELDKFISGRFKELEFVVGNTHFDLNPFNIWLDRKDNILVTDFDNAQIAAYAKDIFDACSKYVKISHDAAKIPEVELRRIFNFSKKYIQNVEISDIKFLLIRPKLGNLFDPKSSYSDEELIKKMDNFHEFCNS